uniref:hypothetical protein n=1 Tax=Sphingobacterium sp. GVS05A TaxID=2862679 RepID=UPI001CBC1ACD
SSHSEQSSQARQSRWYCRNRWESRSVPFFTQKPLLETVKGFLRLHTSQKIPKSNGAATKPTGVTLGKVAQMFRNPTIWYKAVWHCSKVLSDQAEFLGEYLTLCYCRTCCSDLYRMNFYMDLLCVGVNLYTILLPYNNYACSRLKSFWSIAYSFEYIPRSILCEDKVKRYIVLVLLKYED